MATTRTRARPTRPSLRLPSTWGHLGPALLPSQVLGNGAGPPGSSVRDAAEARPSYRGRRDLPLLDLRRWEESCERVSVGAGVGA